MGGDMGVARKYVEANQSLPESQSDLSEGLKTGRTLINCLIPLEFPTFCHTHTVKN